MATTPSDISRLGMEKDVESDDSRWSSEPPAVSTDEVSSRSRSRSGNRWETTANHDSCYYTDHHQLTQRQRLHWLFFPLRHFLNVYVSLDWVTEVSSRSRSSRLLKVAAHEFPHEFPFMSSALLSLNTELVQLVLDLFRPLT